MKKMIKVTAILFAIGVIGLALRGTALSEIYIPIGRVSWTNLKPIEVSLPDIIFGFGFGTGIGIWSIYLKGKK